MQTPFILFDNGPKGGTSVFNAPKQMILAWSPDQVTNAFNQMNLARDAGKWLAGFASYELGYVLEPRLTALLPADRRSPLICFGVFDGPDKVAAQKYMFQAQADMQQAGITAPEPMLSQSQYKELFSQVKDYISAGDIYQANLTFPMHARFHGTALGLYAALQRVQPVKHAALVCLGQGPDLLSRSPELFFHVTADGVIETRPMKGTVPRGKNPVEDLSLQEFLGNDPKNRAENLMIVDLLRNDISRVAEPGTVKVPELFTVESYATVHQMTSLIKAKLRPDLSLPDLLHALFPCGSITGAPKIRAMEILRELESSARDAYCGSIGWMAPDGTASFNVAIRTLSLFADKSVSLNVGGGVVYDSTAASEYEEALWKARYTTLLPPIS